MWPGVVRRTSEKQKKNYFHWPRGRRVLVLTNTELNFIYLLTLKILIVIN